MGFKVAPGSIQKSRRKIDSRKPGADDDEEDSEEDDDDIINKMI